MYRAKSSFEIENCMSCHVICMNITVFVLG